MVLPDGPVPARLAFVGEENGLVEAREGRAFVGPSGQLLWQMSSQMGIQREEVWVTNAALCRAREVTLDNGFVIPKLKVKAAAAKACRRRLVQEIIRVNPTVVVPLGNWALWSLSDIPKARVYAYRGSRLDIDLEELEQKILNNETNEPMRQVKGN